MGNISIYQILLSAISLIFIVNELFKFFRRESGQTLLKFVVIELVWISILTLTLFPGLSRYISQKLGFGENLNTLIFVGFVFVFIIIFRLLSVIEKNEKNLSELVRKEALEKLKERKKNV